MNETEKLRAENAALRKSMDRLLRGQDQELTISTLVSSRTKEGKVEIRWGKNLAQLSPGEARDHAVYMLQAADAAESDAYITEFFESKMGVTEDQFAAILYDFREFREKRKRLDYLPTEKAKTQ